MPSLPVTRQDITDLLVKTDTYLAERDDQGSDILGMIHDDGEDLNFHAFPSRIPQLNAGSTLETLNQLGLNLSYDYRFAHAMYHKAPGLTAVAVVQNLGEQGRAIHALDFDGRAYLITRTPDGRVSADDDTTFVDPTMTRALGLIMIGMSRFRAHPNAVLRELLWTQKETELEKLLTAAGEPDSTEHSCIVGRNVIKEGGFEGEDFFSLCPKPGVHMVKHPSSRIIRFVCETHFQAMLRGGVID